MSRSGSFTKGLGNFVKEYGWLGTVLAALGTASWGVVAYLENAKLDYLKDYNSKQTATFFAVSEAVSSLTTEDDRQKWNQLNKTFWNLHYGDLVLFESPAIECAMTYFGAKLTATSFETRQELGPYAFAVSAELRKFIRELNQKNWKIDLGELTGLKGDIAPLLGLKGERLTASFNPEIQKKIDDKCRAYITPPSDPAVPRS